MPYAAASSARHWARSVLCGHYTPKRAWGADDLPVFVRGEGCFVADDRGRHFFDGISSLFCTQIGHGRADFAKIAADQMTTLAFMPNWSAAHRPAIDAATLIAGHAPGDLDTVFFVNSGAEANESAMKLALQLQQARGYPNRIKFLSRTLAYHGSSFGALSLTGLEIYRAPFERMLIPYCLRIPNTSGDGYDANRRPASITRIEEIIAREGPDTVAAIFAEPVQNGGGALVPHPDYWTNLREICDRYGILLVSDEVIAGFGRLGSWFGVERFGVVPDVITFAKGASSGYVPIGGVVVRSSLMQELLDKHDMFSHGATWGAHPVATAVVAANILAFEEEGVLVNVNTQASAWDSNLRSLADRHAVVKDVRGTGFLHAVELMRDRPSQTELSPHEAQGLLSTVIPEAFRKSGAIFRGDNRGGTMIVVAPPLVAEEAILTRAIDSLDQILGHISSSLKKSH